MDDLFADRALSGRTLARSDVEALAASGAVHLVDCDLEDSDLSGLTLTGWTFERCNLRRVKFASANLAGSKWQSCRGPFADFLGADLSDAAF
ncbi:MAG: pentapeptide repeat-containing protein, partial [Sphingomonadaceae bacterium]